MHRIPLRSKGRPRAARLDEAEGLTFDLSKIDLERLRDEFADYNREKSRTTIEETFRRLIEFGQDLAWASEGDEPGFPCLD